MGLAGALISHSLRRLAVWSLCMLWLGLAAGCNRATPPEPAMPPASSPSMAPAVQAASAAPDQPAMASTQPSLPPASTPARAGPDPANEWRCGWFENPTPGNAWLSDRFGQWLVGVQGGHQAEGNWPEFGPGRWVASNRSYGYGCACLRAVVDAQDFRVLRIVHASSRPLNVCRDDRSLPRPEPR